MIPITVPYRLFRKNCKLSSKQKRILIKKVLWNKKLKKDRISKVRNNLTKETQIKMDLGNRFWCIYPQPFFKQYHNHKHKVISQSTIN